MFSPLARGVGTWNGELHTFAGNLADSDKVLPLLPTDEAHHHHGITVSPRAPSAISRHPAVEKPTTEKPDGELLLPKTFITRKGALMLFSAPDDVASLSMEDKLYMKKARRLLRRRYTDQIAKFGKLSRLAQSILIFGDEEYSPEDASISDPDNKIILKFLHDLDPQQGDKRSRPGSDLSYYLHDLKSRGNSARSRMSQNDGRQTSQSDVFLTPSREPTLLSVDTESLASRIRPNSATCGGEDRLSVSSSHMSRRVLSASKLRASLKSARYMGRPSPTPTSLGEEKMTYPFTPPGSRRSSTGAATYRHAQIPLLELRRRSKTDMDGIEPSSGPEQVKRFLDDIKSEDIREEEDEILESHYFEEPVTIDDEEVKIYDEADELFLEQSLEGATQPLMPVYSGGLSMSTTQFSIDAAQPDNINMNDIVIEQLPDHMINDLSGTGHSLQEALQTITTRDDDEAHHGVTSVEVTNSRRGSADSSHSGYPSEQCQMSPSARLTRVQSARGQRVGSARGARVPSARGGRKLGEEEAVVVEESLLLPPAPPSTRSASPNLDMAQIIAMETAQPIREELVGDAEDLLDNHDVWESLKTDGEMARTDEQATIRRLSHQESSEDIGLMERQGIKETGRETVQSNEDVLVKRTDQEVGESVSRTAVVTGQVQLDSLEEAKFLSDLSGKHPHQEDISESIGDAESITQTEIDVTVHLVGQSGDLSVGDDVTPDQEASKLPASDSSQLEVNQAVDSPAVEVLPSPAVRVPTPPAAQVRGSDKSKNVPKAKITPKVKEASKVKDTTMVKDTMVKDTTKVKESPKRYTSSLGVSQMKTPDKKPVEKNEPLLQGLESYVVKSKKSDTKKKPEAKVHASSPGVGPRMVPAPPQKSKEELALELLEKEVTEILDTKPTETNLSAEEMEIERQLLQDRLQAAEQKVKGEVTRPNTGKRAASTRKGGKPKKGKDIQTSGPDKEELAKQREALREAKKLEKMKRLEDAQLLEEQIKEKEETKEKEEADSVQKSQALNDEIAMMAQEAAEARELEEQARSQMAAERKSARDERDTRRKADVERKKQEAAKRRGHEKKMMESSKQKEQDMLDQIANGEQQRMIAEEERKKREEEERLEQEMIEDEEQELERQAEEDEYNLQELERQAEEEALSFLVREREDAESRQRELQDKAAWENQQIQLKRKEIEEEQTALEEEKRKKEEEEIRQLEEEQKRFQELQDMEREALDRLRKEMEERRAVALRRRHVNLDRRGNLSKLSRGQGLTRPYVFTYYVHWPRETYEKRMGEDPKKKGFRSFKKPKPK